MIFEQYENVFHIINTVIEDIWDEFDSDGNDTLELEETKASIKTTLIKMGEKTDHTDQDFYECFKYFVSGLAQVITKLEMRTFVNKIAGYESDRGGKQRQESGSE